MANRSTPSDKILVDPLFQVPPGAEDQFVFSREDADSDIVEDIEEVEEEDFGGSDDDIQTLDFDDGFDDQNGVTLETPTAFAVIAQAIRRAPGGQQVIDVIIQTEDIVNANNYEIQVTKL
jgi:hypothetical protein